eukprot:Selendium_serpulae@DN8592_c0_g1_i1.p1
MVAGAGGAAIGEALSHNASLKKLHFCHNLVAPAACLAVCEALTRGGAVLHALALDDAGIADGECARIAEALATNQSLRALSLDSNRITDVVRVDANVIGQRGATAIGDALRRNKTLRELHIK